MPFAPWKEILEETAKPPVIYSIPSEVKIFDSLEMWTGDGDSLGRYPGGAFELETWANPVPDLLMGLSRKTYPGQRPSTFKVTEANSRTITITPGDA